MPDPFSIGASVVGLGFSLASGFQAAAAARRAAMFEAAIDDQNANILDMSAADAIARGRYSEGIAKLRGGLTASAQKTAYAASGVDVQSGSAGATFGDTGLMTELNAKIIETNAAREAWGLTTKAGQLRLGAKVARINGDARASEAVLSGVTGAARATIPLLRIGSPGASDYNVLDEPSAYTDPFGGAVQT